MNRTLDLLLLYILRPVTASPSTDIDGHHWSPVPSDSALYTLLTLLKRLLNKSN
jgi:hypothetical protein